MRCSVCNSEINLKRKYDNHAKRLHLKPFIKRLLSSLDFLIPTSMARLKRVSSVKRVFFKGSVGICSNCGHGEMTTKPTKEQLIDYYENSYWASYSRPSKVKQAMNINDYKNNPRAIHQVNFSLSEINSISGHIDVLEIGAAAAYSLMLFRDRIGKDRVNLNVCEPGKNWESYYIRHNIKKVARYFPFETQLSFDYLHTSHWLEHVLDLNETISELGRLTKPNGYIFVEVPNTEHFYWDLPIEDIPHIHFFTRKSLTLSFESHGFECCNIEECGITYAEGYAGVSVTSDRYGECDKGYWIRALFRKI